MPRKRIPIVRPDAVIAESPGTLVAPPGSHPTTISVLAYGPEALVEEDIEDLGRIREFMDQFPVVWVNAVGLGDVERLDALGDQFDLHRLGLEDAISVPQRPKIDDYGEHQYIVARMPLADRHLETEQLSMFLGKGWLISVQEKPGDWFDGVRTRIRSGRPRIRESGSDYLLYSLLDALVDSYFPLLEHVGSRLEELEQQLYEDAERDHLRELHALKRDLITLRRYVWPLRELNNTLLRPDSGYMHEKTRTYMRDCYDHSVNALELVESYRDIASGLMDLSLSIASQRMNEVMKVLTIIATLFIPLSFIAGLYGMNFDASVSKWNMPELSLSYGYPLALGAMAICASIMLWYFWKSGWFR